MKSKKGFTIVELIIVIGLLIVIAGLFTFNMIKIMNKNKDDEIKNVERQLVSAADAYVTMNPSAVQRLYNGYGYVDIEVGILRKFGLVNDDIKDPKTGKRIPDDRVVRVKINEFGELIFEYNADGFLIAYDLELQSETIDIEHAGNWCRDNAMDGLHSKIKLKDENDKDAKDEDYKNIRVKSCNVEAKIGTYRVDYEYTDPALNIVKTKQRKVYVSTSEKDIISFNAEITNYDNGKSILQGSKDVEIKITETLRNGSTNTQYIPGTDEYEVLNLNPNKIGKDTAIVRRLKQNISGFVNREVRISYEIVPIKVSYDANGGKVGSPSADILVENVIVGQKYGNLPTPIRSDYKFNGWFTAREGGEKITSDTIVTNKESHTLYAHWIMNAPSFKLVDDTYNKASGTWRKLSEASFDLKIDDSEYEGSAVNYTYHTSLDSESESIKDDSSISTSNTSATSNIPGLISNKTIPISYVKPNSEYEIIYYVKGCNRSNQCTEKEYIVRVDDLPPEISVTQQYYSDVREIMFNGFPAYSVHGNWVNYQMIFKDNGSGYDTWSHAKVVKDVDNIPKPDWVTHYGNIFGLKEKTESSTIHSNGSYIVYGRDRVGNVGHYSFNVSSIDEAPPVITVDKETSCLHSINVTGVKYEDASKINSNGMIMGPKIIDKNSRYTVGYDMGLKLLSSETSFKYYAPEDFYIEIFSRHNSIDNLDFKDKCSGPNKYNQYHCSYCDKENGDYKCYVHLTASDVWGHKSERVYGYNMGRSTVNTIFFNESGSGCGFTSSGPSFGDSSTTIPNNYPASSCTSGRKTRVNDGGVSGSIYYCKTVYDNIPLSNGSCPSGYYKPSNANLCCNSSTSYEPGSGCSVYTQPTCSKGTLSSDQYYCITG